MHKKWFHAKHAALLAIKDTNHTFCTKCSRHQNHKNTASPTKTTAPSYHDAPLTLRTLYSSRTHKKSNSEHKHIAATGIKATNNISVNDHIHITRTERKDKHSQARSSQPFTINNTYITTRTDPMHNTCNQTNQNTINKNQNLSRLPSFFINLLLNHVQLPNLQKMAKQKLLNLPAILKVSPQKRTCFSCEHGKRRPKPHKRSTHNYNVGIGLSSDIVGPINPPSVEGNSYLFVFIDNGSRFGTGFFTKTKSEVLRALRTLIHIIRNSPHVTLQFFTSDNVKEYLSKTFTELLAGRDIRLETTIPHSPQ